MQCKKIIFVLATISLILSCCGSKVDPTPQPEPEPIHIHTIVEDKGYEATCEDDGLTDGKHCSDCEEILVPQEIIPAKGHKYRLLTIATEHDEIDREGHFYCENCTKTIDKSIESKDVNNMPIIEFNGDISKMSKEKAVDLSVNYISENLSFTSNAKVKWQGTSSITYPKKNYNMTFYNEEGKKNKIQIKEEWGKQSKYCLKANWVDYSQSRNVVAGRIFNSIVKSRNIDDELNALPNGGVVDGFPVLMYINGEFFGYYTMNIPRDKWMYGMNDEGYQAAMFANTHDKSPCLKEPINEALDNGWEVEHCSTEDNEGTGWIRTSLNNFISFLMNSSDKEFKDKVNNYTNLNRAIDALIFINFIGGADNYGKNIMWLTYDGIKWVPSLYDMDGTFGMMYHGESYYKYDEMPMSEIVNYGNANLLFKRMYNCFYTRIVNRYKMLRQSLLSYENILSQFDIFFASVNPVVEMYNLRIWPTIPRPDLNNMEQISDWVKNRGTFFDSKMS